ncbi:MAG: pseudouridine synthase [Bacterioplanes sp.]|nr:pseudouridine synthase [Bacterioplanes sp.]
MRMDKYLTLCTELTRTTAKKSLHAGRVKINGVMEKNSGYHVQTDDIVSHDDIVLNLPDNGARYAMLHKPANYECSHQPSHHPSIFQLLDCVKAEQLHCVGRLDQDTTGLVLLTDDGQWSHRLTSPKHQHNKYYLVTTEQPITDEQCQQLRDGVLLHGEQQPSSAVQVERCNEQQIQLVIQEGKYHQVKRMLAAVDHHVVALHREQIAHIPLDPTLAPGEWRWLTASEVALS